MSAVQLEYVVKAAMLYRCAELVQWPSNAAAAAEPTLTIGVLGKNRFGKSLDRLAGKTVSGRKLVVRKFSRVSKAASCQLVFVSASEIKRTPKILETLAAFPVLTVGEAPGFAELGGMINLLLQDKYIKLEVNPVAAEKARIVLDPRLVKMALPEPALTPNASAGS